MIVDDHALVRLGIRRLLEDVHDIEVIAEADSGEKALKVVRTLEPDVVLLDMKLPGIDGLEVTRRLTRTPNRVKIIVLTAFMNDTFPTRILQAGALAYLTKECGIDEMANAIRKVSQGERYLSAEVAQAMALNSLTPSKAQENPFSKLSEREMQVTLMITKGMQVQEIADNLCLTAKTVNGYRYRLFAKLDIKNDVELTYLALKYGLIEAPQPELVEDESK